MALSKLEEWLQNTTGSFLQFRLNAALRTVHRRHIAFQVFICGATFRTSDLCGHIHLHRYAVNACLHAFGSKIRSLADMPSASMRKVQIHNDLQRNKWSLPQMLLLEKQKNVESKREFVELCKLRGYFLKDVEELNDLGETRLMAAAAEGRLGRIQVANSVKNSFLW